MEDGALDYFETIDGMGGMVAAIENGYPQREVAESAYAFQRGVESGEKTIVGVNRFITEEDKNIETLYIDETTSSRQIDKLENLRATRDKAAVTRSLDVLRHAALGTDNLMPLLVDAVRAYATVGEVCDALRDVWGEYEETPAV